MSPFNEENNNSSSITPTMTPAPSSVSDFDREAGDETLFDLGAQKKVTRAQFRQMALGVGYTPARSCPTTREICYIAMGVGLGLFLVLLVTWLFPFFTGRRCIANSVNVEEAESRFNHVQSPQLPTVRTRRRRSLETLDDDESDDFDVLMREVEELRTAARENVSTTRDRLLEVLSRQDPPTYAETLRGSGDGREENETLFMTAREYATSSTETLVPATTAQPVADTTMTMSELERGSGEGGSGETNERAAGDGAAVDIL
ncbi:Oidioi.mRNA.OKI2018_I69.chr1.g1456.t1.cds [Oikopleura dioica]|uniref:Oidioi.mRNA.OKI2018_I69.chr1.g1456.t1.cds n=1 Tax=Oikopleura dioica TaxID=34765 RepID=A0ABN7SRS5_OIKDI|nr:Oidioi.mRNA.OKI2018_I69.chr1.g1456.t1.cds [Oikopleura dioica]